MKKVPAVAAGYCRDESGTLSVNGKTYAAPQASGRRVSSGSAVVAVKVGRSQAIVAVGGFYAPGRRSLFA